MLRTIATASHAPGAIQMAMACRTYLSRMISGPLSFIATMATVHLPLLRNRRTSKASGWDGLRLADFDNDGRQDVYVPSMWEAAGQRVSGQKQFHQNAPERVRGLYQRHARGNALYRNQGDGTFQNVGREAGVEMGRWSWSSDFWDFDHDGFADLYVANGYLSGVERQDLASFFWRQVVANRQRMPRHLQHMNAAGMRSMNGSIGSYLAWVRKKRDVREQTRMAHSLRFPSHRIGLPRRQPIILTRRYRSRWQAGSRSQEPQRTAIAHSSQFDPGNWQFDFVSAERRQKHRDAIGASITVEAGTLRQIKYLQSGSGFLSSIRRNSFSELGGRNNHSSNDSLAERPFSNIREHSPNHFIEVAEGSDSFTS